MKKMPLLLCLFSLIGCSKPNQISSNQSNHSSYSSEQISSSSEDFSSSTIEESSSSEVQYFSFETEIVGLGSISGNENGTYEKGTVIELIATPEPHYYFSGFYHNDELVCNQTTYSFTIEADTFLEVRFVKDYHYQTYYHKFSKSDFVSSGGTTKDINGLTWDYSAFSYLGGSTNGVQIGSKNSPQLTPWTLKTVFPSEIRIISYQFEICNAIDGGGNYSISFGDHNVSDSFSSSNELKKIGQDQLDVSSSELTFSLVSSVNKAMYFYSFSFVAYVDDDVDLTLKGDEDSATPVVPGEGEIPSINYEPISVETYYEKIDFESSDLLSSLRGLISEMTKVSYGNCKTMLQYTDENPKKPGYMYGLYDGDNILAQWDSGASWNREHVWACSQMKLDGVDPRPEEYKKNHATDLHNLRAACPIANGKHGNKFYDEEDTATTLYPNINKGLTGYHAYQGDFRGDVARILFYMYVRYEGLELNDDIDIENDVSMGKLSILLKWNSEDPVDEFEIQRNNRIYAYQGNRNPFIDYPQIANKIFA